MRAPFYLNRNFTANTLDGVLFSTGVGFFSHAGVVPLFVDGLTPARWPIALVTPVLMIGIALPQLLGAWAADAPGAFWPLVVRAVWLPRLALVLLAGVPFLPAPYVLPAFFAVWLGYALALGFVIPLWLVVVAQVIPVEDRGKFFGIRTALGGVAAALGATAAAGVLARWPGPVGFAACFGLAAAFLVASLGAFFATRHDWAAFEAERAARREAQPAFWAQARAVLAGEPAFRRYLAARVLMAGVVASTGFYAVHAVEAFGLTTAEGSLLALAIIFGPNLTAAFWGWLADRVGNRAVQLPAVVAAGIASLWLATTPPLPVYVCLLVIAGFVTVVNQLVDNKFMMDLDAARCGLLLGVMNLVLTPFLLILPAAAGVLAERAGVPAVFAATGGCLGLSAAVLLLFPPRRVT